MGTLWPDPPALPARCKRCRAKTARANLTDGYGPECARKLGLITAAKRTRTTTQTGIDLLDLIEPEPEDNCDGHDR